MFGGSVEEPLEYYTCMLFWILCFRDVEAEARETSIFGKVEPYWECTDMNTNIWVRASLGTEACKSYFITVPGIGNWQ